MPAERMPPDESLLSQPLARLTEWTLRSPVALLWCVAISALVAVVITLSGLKFRTSRLDLLNPTSRYNQRWIAYLDEFGDRDDAVVVVRADDPAAVRAALDDVAQEITAQPQLFDSVFWRRDLSRLKSKGLHLVPTTELARLAASLRSAAEAQQLANPAAALARLNARLAGGANQRSDEREQLERQYARLAGILLAATAGPEKSAVAQAGMQRPAELAAADGVQRLLAGLSHLEPQYLTADEGRMGFVLVKLVPEKDGFVQGGTAIGKLREILQRVRAQQPSAWIGLTGMPVIEYDEMRISQWDMLWTNVVSLAGCVLLFVAGYGGIRHAGMAAAVLLVGMAWSFAFVTLTVGHLNILSSAFAIVLIGLGIDFGIHYAANYLKLRGLGVDPHSALVQTARDIGPSVVISGVTTAAAFFMAGTTQFVGVRELGIIAGSGILLCVVSAIVVLPPLIFVFDRERPPGNTPTLLPVALWLSWLHARPGLVLSLAVIATAASLVGVTRLKYDHNLLHLQPSHVESVQIEEQIFAEQEDSVWFAVSLCGSRKELARRKALFEKLPSVAKIEEIASLIPEPDSQRNALVAEIHRSLATLLEDAPANGVGAGHPDDLSRELTRGIELLSADLPYERPAAQALDQAARRLAQIPPPNAAAVLEGISAAARTELREAALPLAPLLDLADPSPPTTADLPRELADRYIGRTGKHLLKVYARGDIWDMERLQRFVAEVESIDPLATGHPVQTYYASRHLQISYVQAGVCALLAVFALIFLDFRSIRHSLLAMVPLAMGFLQMCGMIGWLGIPLNAANLIALPLILGIGVDDGVHLVHEMRRRRGRFRLSDASGVGIMLVSTTTMAGFGALILARHQGLRSLGQVLTLGTFLCLTCSLVAFPALLTWLTGKREEHEEEQPLETENAVEASEAPAGEVAAEEEAAPGAILEATGAPLALSEEAAEDPLAPPAAIVPRRRAG